MRRMSMDLELPLGLGMAMAGSPEAAERYAALPEAERQALVEQARNAHTRQEMQACISSLLK